MVSFGVGSIPSDVSLAYDPDEGVVWVECWTSEGRTGIYRIDEFYRLLAECWRLRCLYCDGKGYVWSGGDMGSGGPCGRCGGAGFDPDPDDAERSRRKSRRKRKPS